MKSPGNCKTTFNMYALRINCFVDPYILYILLKSSPIAGSLRAVYPWRIHHEKATHVLRAHKLIERLMLLPADTRACVWGSEARLKENGHILAVTCFELQHIKSWLHSIAKWQDQDSHLTVGKTSCSLPILHGSDKMHIPPPDLHILTDLHTVQSRHDKVAAIKMAEKWSYGIYTQKHSRIKAAPQSRIVKENFADVLCITGL